MEQTGGLIAVLVYLAILAFAVAWFLLPRWLRQRKADANRQQRPGVARATPASDVE